MTIDWPSFTPGAAALGGALIGLAAGLFALFNGRIAGISGILGGLLSLSRPRLTGDTGWRLAFLGGLLAAPWLASGLGHAPSITVEANTPTLIVAGLLVGIGTRYGSGCTSGHGVCGLSRGSPRSLVATAVFMGAGAATVFAWRHLF